MRDEYVRNKRKSNIELLRILSMMFIIFSHYSVHGGLINIDGINSNKIIGIILFLVRKSGGKCICSN